MSSDDFKDTLYHILNGPSSVNEKFLIIETVLAIVTRSGQLKAKLDNSSLNQEFKDQLVILQSERNNPDRVKKPELIKKLVEILILE